MPWPDFTELSFGYCFLRELETRYTREGRFPKAPDFISQYAEKTEGYDVEVAMDGSVPVFIQLKRSMVMKTLKAREFSSPFFARKPVFRMNLHHNDQFAQHLALQTLERAGNNVIYATSQIENPQDLITHTKNRTLVSSASAIFSPLSIVLPTLHEPHHVSFYANQGWAVLFSEQGERFERKWASSSEWLAGLLETPRSREENEKSMLLAERTLLRTFHESELNLPSRMIAVIDGLHGAAARVSALVHFLLDAQLMFVKPPADGE